MWGWGENALCETTKDIIWKDSNPKYCVSALIWSIQTYLPELVFMIVFDIFLDCPQQSKDLPTYIPTFWASTLMS